MKRLLIPLLAALALPSAVNAEVKVKPAVSNFSYVLYKHLELGFNLGYSIDRTTLLYKDDDADHAANLFALSELGNIYSRIIKVPVGKDPGNISQSEAQEALQ